jgi:hypothetical protein
VTKRRLSVADHELTKAEFRKLVDAYFGAKDHEKWARENGTPEEHRLALEAVEKARQVMLDGVPR